MSHQKSESLHFYKYLCQKIGSEKKVTARRLAFIYSDLQVSNQLFLIISSGSKGEGLDLKGSDFDIMHIFPFFKVFESDKDIKPVKDYCLMTLVMNIEDTQPCFTHLQLYSNYNIVPDVFKQTLLKHRGMNVLSSDLYKSHCLSFYVKTFSHPHHKIHGPCITDYEDEFDTAFCIKCDQWLSIAQPWITRPRSAWPSPELISKITSCGVLFVPIGYKGSINEHLQWRISFSVAEKILIYSFSHTQLLCYALLKILLKEIVNRNKDLKGLLCSYFLKTLMFWISEETDTSEWRSDNIIPCFMACLKRLIYCIKYSTLLHYFIPDNNLFYTKFLNSKNQNTLINILKNAYQTGIQIFSSSETLHDYKRFPCVIAKSVCETTTLIKTIVNHFSYPTEQPSIGRINKTFTTFLHQSYLCRRELSRYILTLLIADTYKRIPSVLQHVNNPNNKQQYRIYKHELSQWLVGVQTDAVFGWLKLASFFYCHKHYYISIDIINYTLSKCTYESILSMIPLKQIEKQKLISLLKTYPNPLVSFTSFPIYSSILPMELRSDFFEPFITVNYIPFAYIYFLLFLCYYHLEDTKACQWHNGIYPMLRTILAMDNNYQNGLSEKRVCMQDFILLGIANQMFGNSISAKDWFRVAASMDPYKFTSAAFRLQQIS
ncbi:Hypothetical predicted protein [Mytilus galloprovincialis]|uniref:Mab-21-like HhH/H2TH-like domain-containing protein n=1 Tax=Mytilus galloprovincialis TaxID=29158 RepID=A0A8B6D4M0_MYTGA|nr:Hypothetical predicted protein [Mytilus galloprovincialis]